MSSSFKKIISVILVLVMASYVFAVTSSAEVEAPAGALISTKPSSEIVPMIIIPGISQSNSVYCDANGNPILDKNGKKLEGGLLIIDTPKVVSSVFKNLTIPLVFTLLNQKTDEDLPLAVYNTVSDIFYIQASDKNGDPVNNLVVDKYEYPLSDYSQEAKDWFYRRLPMEPVIEEMNATYGVDGEKYTYLYTFPLIGDPMTSAEGLFDYIAMVKEQTGCKKVNLVPISLGGTIMTAYFDLVRERGGDFSDINSVIDVVACLNGTDLLADFYQRNWNLSDEFVYSEYLPMVMKEQGLDEYVGHLINIALRIFPKETLYTMLTSAMDAILDTILVNCPQFWSMVPSDRYEGLANSYLSTPDTANLRARTDRFQNARLDLKDNLTYAHDKYGVNIYNVCGYGRQYDTGDYCFFGITGSSKTSNSDSIIDIDSSSLGATYAVAGKFLPNGNSPDKELDVSTCLFPDTTWFFKNQHHEVGRDDVVIRLLAGIVSENITDVNSNPAFPQFNYARNTRTLTRPDGLMVKAEQVLANADGAYTEEQIAVVKPAYEKAKTFLDNTILNINSDNEAQAITTELNDALSVTGLTSKTESVSFFVRFLNVLTRVMDNAIMSSIGGKGFVD